MIQRFQLVCRGGRLCPPARNTTAGWSFAANSHAPSALTVGADAHIGPLGSYEFAEDFHTNGAFCRADVGIGPYDAFKDSVGIFELVLVSQERFKKTESVFFRRSKRKSCTAVANS